MIVTEGFEPIEGSVLAPIGPNLVFVEHRDCYDGNHLVVLHKKGSYSETWRIDLSEVVNYMVVPRAALKTVDYDQCFYKRKKSPYIDYTVRLAHPLHDDVAERLRHFRIVTDTHFVDFVSVSEEGIVLKGPPEEEGW